MLDTLAGIALLSITELLMISAWLSVSVNKWIYYFGAAIVIFLWGHPWTRKNLYQTSRLGIRTAVYIFLILVLVFTAFAFGWSQIYILAAEAIILLIIEIKGRTPSTQS